MVKAPEIGGIATLSALQSLASLLHAFPWSLQVIRQVVEGVEQCKFEETARDFDESVLYKKIEVLMLCVTKTKEVALMQAANGAHQSLR